MNFLSITELKLAGQTIKPDTLASYLRDRLADANIKCDMKVGKYGIEIIQNSEKKLFMSSKINYIPLKEGDPLIKKKGRDYLESQRLTEKQLEQLKKIFSLHLDQVHVSCLVKLHPSKEDLNSFVVIRDSDNNNFLDKWPMPSSFPLERN